MKKLRIIGVLTLMFTMILAVPVFAENQYNYDVKVNINGSEVNFPDQKPFIEVATNRTFVPVRFVSEALGAKVSWEDATYTAVIQRNDKTIRMAIGSDQPTVDGVISRIDAKAQLVNNRTMVPLRFISETLDCQIEWDQATRTVKISDKYNGEVEVPDGYYMENGYMVPKDHGFWCLKFTTDFNHPVISVGLEMDGTRSSKSYDVQLKQLREMLESKHDKELVDELMKSLAKKKDDTIYIFDRIRKGDYEIWLNTVPDQTRSLIYIYQLSNTTPDDDFDDPHWGNGTLICLD